MTLVTQGEARRAERVYTRIPIALLLGLEGCEAERPATTADVSPHGARILTEAALVPGQTVELMSCKAGARLASARVVWVSVEPAKATQAGLEFLD
jgi:hypothetical protein